MVAASLGGTRLLRNGGALAFAVEGVPGSFGGNTDWVSLFDGDQDGDLDLLWVENDWFSADPEVRVNDGAGGYTTFPLSIFVEVAFMRIAEAVDLNGDGDPDFACIGSEFQSGTSDSLFLRYGTPGLGSGFAPGHQEELFLGGRIVDLRAADLDGDGLQDLVAANHALSRLDLVRNASCVGPPSIAAAAPTAGSALTPQPIRMTLEGCGLGAVTAVTVAGAPAEFEHLFQQRIVVTLPPAPQLGPVPVEVTAPLGTASMPFTYGVPPQPLLVLPGIVISIADGLVLRAGAKPGDVVFALVSPDLVPTTLPGLVNLWIGNGGATLTLLATLPIPAKAWTEFTAPVPPALQGEQFHFQGAVLTPSAPSFPLATTGIVTRTVWP